MKKLLLILLIGCLYSCTNQSVFEHYELSYSRSGGYAPIYENLLIEGNTARFYFEGQNQKYNKKTSISNDEKALILKAIETSKLKEIREDYKKVYDNITTTIKVKTPNEKLFKDDGSFIIPEHQARWNSIIQAFESFIQAKKLRQ